VEFIVNLELFIFNYRRKAPGQEEENRCFALCQAGLKPLNLFMEHS
jgi:hypothetical protein